jgi:hypothetical protein
VVLHEFDDDHHLGAIEQGDTFRQLLEEVYALQFKVPSHSSRRVRLAPGSSCPVVWPTKVAECVAADDRAGAKESTSGGGRMALFEQITARRKNNG